MRGIFKAVYAKQEITDLITLEDNASLEEIKAAIELMKKALTP